MESNDSPEIPDRGETSDIPGLPSGLVEGKEFRSAATTHGKTFEDVWTYEEVTGQQTRKCGLFV